MVAAFDDRATLYRRSRRRLAVAAALASTSLVPSTLGSAFLTVAASDRADRLALLYVMILGALVGGLLMAWSTPSGSDPLVRVVPGAVAGAIAYTVLLVWFLSHTWTNGPRSGRGCSSSARSS